MKYSNTIDTISTIIDTHGFESTFVSYNFPIRIATANNPNLRSTTDIGVVQQGIASAIGGNKSIVFTEQLHAHDATLKRLTRSFCVIITTSAPPIAFPTIFTRQLSDLPEDVNTAVLVSSKSLIPVVIYLGSTALFDYTNEGATSSSHERVSLPPWEKALDKPVTQATLSDAQALAHKTLSSILPKWVDGILGSNVISHSSSEGSFVRFITPHSLLDTCQLINDKISAGRVIDKDEEYLSALLYPFALRQRMTTFHLKNNNKPYLCPGCPFVEISQSVGENDSIYTNVNCPEAIQFFKLNPVNLREFSSLATTSKNPSSMIFVDHLHNYSTADKHLLSSGGIIFLNTVGGDTNKTFKAFSPSALKSNKRQTSALLFPYSCHSIPNNKAKKVLPKKCKCTANGEEPTCLINTGCPALVLQDGKVTIFPDICVGCSGCKISCPYGAI